MKILVTGGFGYLGSSITKALMHNGHEITVIDDLSSGERIDNKDIELFEISTSDPMCRKIFESNKFDVVIHLAYRGYDTEIFKPNSYDTYINNISTNNILNISLDNNVKKVILVSSIKVYGERGDRPFSETCKGEPLTEEGYSYLTREMIARNYNKLGLDLVIVRAGIVYGLKQYGVDSALINNGLIGKGDLIYIEDFSEAIAKIVSAKSESIINLSSNEGKNNIMDSTKIRTIIDWVPKVDWYSGQSLVGKKVSLISKNKNIESNSNEVSSEINYKYMKVVLFFILSFIINYILRAKVKLDIDIFIIFIIFVSLSYGFKYSILGLILSIIAYTWFSLWFDEKTILTFIYDLNNTVTIVIYFMLGYSLGLYRSLSDKEKNDLEEEVTILNRELDFTNSLLNSAVQSKDKLQNIIENYSNNFSNINYILERLSNLSPDKIEEEIPKIFSDNFNVESANFYIFNKETSELYLKSTLGKNMYSEILRVDEYGFLQDVLRNNEIYVNRKMIKNTPTIAIPFMNKTSILGLLFLDEIDFRNLNQQYINKLIIASKLISNAVY